MPRRFGEKLAYLRNDQGLTQASLVTQLGLASQTHISNLEAGRRKPSIDLIIRVADCFQVTVDYLIRDTIAVHQAEKVLQRFPLQEKEPECLGEKLRYIRAQRGISQSELGRQLAPGSQAYFSNIEAGRKIPSLEIIVNIADFFDVTTDYLIRDSIPIEK